MSDTHLIAPAMPRCWRQQTKPHKFCGGCGHGIILKMLGEVIDELNVQEQVIFMVDIGCSLLAVDFFDCDTVQTHHGRTTPVAAGLKRADPKKLCIAYMGDGGGYAIGAQHLVAAVARNDLICAILVNNANYGMTGGQMAPTTLLGQKTQTTPFGRELTAHGAPLHGPEMLASTAQHGAYIARGSAAEPRRLKQYFKKALRAQIEGRGFAFVEALSPCPINWAMDAHEAMTFLERDMKEVFPLGEFRTPFGRGTGND